MMENPLLTMLSGVEHIYSNMMNIPFVWHCSSTHSYTHMHTRFDFKSIHLCVRSTGRKVKAECSGEERERKKWTGVERNKMVDEEKVDRKFKEKFLEMVGGSGREK